MRVDVFYMAVRSQRATSGYDVHQLTFIRRSFTLAECQLFMHVNKERHS